MREYIVAILVIACILVYQIMKKIKENTKEKRRKEVVAWCVNEPNRYRDYLYLWEYISNAQIKLNLLQEYRISTDEEWDLAKEIIKGFQKDITRKFFSNQLSLPTSKYVISDETYFMYLLQEYLEQHQFDIEFLGYNMYKETISYKSYGSWGGPLYDATYALTDFAVVFQKIYYISYIHCKNSSAINPKGKYLYWANEHSIEDIIDSRRFSVYSYK